jgi:hypothetical protein
MGITRELPALVLEELAKQCRHGKAIIERSIVGNLTLIFLEGYVEAPRDRLGMGSDDRGCPIYTTEDDSTLISPDTTKPPARGGFVKSERQDLNLRPPLPQD